MAVKELIEIEEKELIKRFKKSKDVFRIPRKYKIPEHLIFQFSNEVAENCSKEQKYYGWRDERNWWQEIAVFQPLSESFILEVENMKKWNYTEQYSNFYFYNIWYNIFRYQNLSEKFIIENQKKIEDERYFWNSISSNVHLTQEFIDKYLDKLNWECVSGNVPFTEQMIEKYEDKIVWKEIWLHQKLSEEFVLKYQNKIEWVHLLKNNNLSKDFYERNKHLITTKIYAKDLAKIVEFQTLSEDTLSGLKKGKMVWDSVALNCDVSRDFVISNYDKLRPFSLVHGNKKLNKEVKDEVKMIEQLSGNTYI